MTHTEIAEEIFKKCPDANVHYVNRYVRFVSACKSANELTSEYTEKHHILPSSMWPEYHKLTRHPWNCCRVTPRQHIVCHWILARAVGGYMWNAVFAMVTGFSRNYRNAAISYKEINSRLYEESVKYKSQQSKAWWTPARRKAKSEKSSGPHNHFYGCRHTPETLQHLSDVKKGEKHPFYGTKRPDHAKLISSLFKGREVTEEHRANISKSHNKTYTCPHCGANGSRLILRWHFDHCYMVDVSKNLFRATSPQGEQLFFGSITSFAEAHGLSASVIRSCLKNNTPTHSPSKPPTKTSDQYEHTVKWRFYVERLVKPIK